MQNKKMKSLIAGVAVFMAVAVVSVGCGKSEKMPRSKERSTPAVKVEATTVKSDNDAKQENVQDNQEETLLIIYETENKDKKDKKDNKDNAEETTGYVDVGNGENYAFDIFDDEDFETKKPAKNKDKKKNNKSDDGTISGEVMPEDSDDWSPFVE